jgi:predicted component of type VI protein secretion system
MAAYLVPLESGACVIPLEKAILLIGRQADCDVSLTSSRKISRKHCCIAIVNEAVMVRDLGSTNGVTINGDKIEREGRLRMGDELSIGDVRFRLQREPKLPPSSTAPTHDDVPPDAARSPRPDRSRPTAPEPPPSMDFPVALADDGQEFAVESTYPKLRPLDDHRDSGPLVPFNADARDALPLPSDSV